MRLAAQAKLGFYPAHPDAIRALLSHFSMPHDKPEKVHVIDPCCGKGEAVAQIAEGLGVPFERTYAVELDTARTEDAKARMPGAHVLGPASFMGARITGSSFSLAYVNPPFDDELGGGRRQEYSFAMEATRLIRPGGILALVMPITAISGRTEFHNYLDSQYEEAAIFEFPAHVRKFKEIVYIGRRRKAELPARWDGFCATKFGYQNRYGNNPFPVLGDTKDHWQLTWSWAPNTFAKVQFTDEELIAAIEGSPMNRLLDPPKPAKASRPPLPLYKGHVALLLASGMLDGVVCPPGEEPHVVRGTARKETFLADKTTTENTETGVVTEKEVHSQKIVLTVRAVGPDGEIKTFADKAKTEAEKAAEAEAKADAEPDGDPADEMAA